MAADFVTIATTAVLTQFLAPAAKNLGEVAFERAKQIGSKAVGYLAAVGREPQPVVPKILLPLVQAASLEADEALVKRWAALLANAADPTQRVAVLPSFADMLRQLTPLDAAILQAVAAASHGQQSEIRTYLYAPSSKIQREVGEGNDEPTTTFQIGIDNLLRLRLCEGRGVTRPPVGPTNTLSDMISGHSLTLAEGPGKDRLAVTALGLAFLAAVTPPTL